MPSQNVGVPKGAAAPAVSDSSVSAALTAAVLAGPWVTACCQAGIAQDSEIPPPPAPQSAPSFQTCSLGGWVAASMVVPPTDTTYGWLAGSSTDRTFWPEGGDEYRYSLQESLPVSPSAESTVWPCAAACWKRTFSASWRPGSAVCASCSQTPQLDVTTWSASLLIIAEYSSRPPIVVLGAWYTSMFAPGAMPETSSMSSRDSPLPLPGGRPPSTDTVDSWLPAMLPPVPDICAAAVAPK